MAKSKEAKMAAVAKAARVGGSPRGRRKPKKGQKVSGAVSLGPPTPKAKTRKRKRKAESVSPSSKITSGDDGGPVLGKRLTAIASGLGGRDDTVSAAISGAALGATVGEAIDAGRKRRRKRKKDG